MADRREPIHVTDTRHLKGEMPLAKLRFRLSFALLGRRVVAQCEMCGCPLTCWQERPQWHDDGADMQACDECNDG